jgi:hypothetical protein
MNRRGFWITCVTVLMLMLSACGGQRPPSAEPTPAQLLPAEIASTGWVRDPELLRFAGDSLFEYINGAAEMYQKYDFVVAHVGNYRKGDSEITADLYEFADADGSYGMYTTLRPVEPDGRPIGVEGFSLGYNLIFVKGKYIVNLATYDDPEIIGSSMSRMATAIAAGLPGTTEQPAVFGLFPKDGRLVHTEKVFAESYLGFGFLTHVYTVDFSRDDEALTLFVTDDPAGEKFDLWSERAAQAEAGGDLPDLSDLPYDAGRVLAVRDSYHGQVVAGLRAGRLVGIVGYRPEYHLFVATWLQALPGPTEP